jgi:hypothetical protein
MPFFALLESFFFMSLALSFFLILLMVYHFKKRMDALEKKNDTIADICKELLKDIDQMKITKPPMFLSPQNMPFPNTQPEFSFGSFPDQMKMQSGFNPVEELYKQIRVVEEDSETQPLDLKVYENEELENVETYDSDTDNESVNTSKGTMEEIPIQDENDIQLTKLDETEPLEEVSVITELEPKTTKSALQKMTVQMLKTIVIRDGLCTDPSKMKKAELIELIRSANESNTSEESKPLSDRETTPFNIDDVPSDSVKVIEDDLGENEVSL